MINKNYKSIFQTTDFSYKAADVVIFGAPFDGTTSFKPGTRFAPNAIRYDSYAIEYYSPYLDRELNDVRIYDSGDIDIPLGNTKKILDMFGKYQRKLLSDGKLPVCIGGEHLISLPLIHETYKKHPDLVVMHFDAHTDLRDEFFHEKLSHATVLRRAHDFLGDGRIYQYGIRSGDKSEFEWAKTHVKMNKFNCDSILKDVAEIGDKPVYVTIDLDIMDPSVFRGTGTPEPGGITFKEMLEAIYALKPLNVVAADIVELAPNYDSSGVSTAVAIKTLRELILTIG